jgi:hypothetical protein
MTRRLAWIGTLGLVVLGGRGLAYALSPSPLAADFSGRVGGPALPAVALVSVALALACATAVVGLAALAVRERLLLEAVPVSFEPRLRLLRLLGRALALWVLAMPAFALLESYIHWRAGLGWHGLHCLVGPAHRNAIPLLGGLSLVAAAFAAATEHALAWMRRTVASLAPAPVFGRPLLASAVPHTFVPTAANCRARAARGPPLRS